MDVDADALPDADFDSDADFLARGKDGMALFRVAVPVAFAFAFELAFVRRKSMVMALSIMLADDALSDAYEFGDLSKKPRRLENLFRFSNLCTSRGFIVLVGGSDVDFDVESDVVTGVGFAFGSGADSDSDADAGPRRLAMILCHCFSINSVNNIDHTMQLLIPYVVRRSQAFWTGSI